MKKQSNSLTDKPIKLTHTLLKRLWRMAVLKKAFGICQYPGCKCSTKLNAHHIIDKQIHLLMYEPDNGLALCFYHHKMGLMSAHKSPFFLQDMIEGRMIEQGLVDWLEMTYKEELIRMSNKIKPKNIKLIRQEAFEKLNNL